MDTNYNINIINEQLNLLFKNLIVNNKKAELNDLLSSILHEKSSNLINKELAIYPKKILRLVIERNILLSMENKALEAGTTYLNVLKNSESKFNINILHHYFDSYIKDIKRNNLLYENKKSIDELRNIYNEEIKDNLKIMDKDIEKNIDSISSISLNHMENLNANGRTVSINNNGGLSKKGGIFLDKKSNIGYGKFVNKNELIDIVRKTKKIDGIDMKSIGIRNLKMIMKSLTQTININSNEKIKNQDARVISIGDKKAGSIFLGNKNIDLPNGEYVSMEEITYAINKFLEDKKTIDKPVKVEKVKTKVKESIVVAALVATTLSTSITNVSASSVPETIVTEVNDDIISNIESINTNEIMSSNIESINTNDIVNETKEEVISYSNEIINNIVDDELQNSNEIISISNEEQLEEPEKNAEEFFQDSSNETNSEHGNTIEEKKETFTEEMLVDQDDDSIEEENIGENTILNEEIEPVEDNESIVTEEISNTEMINEEQVQSIPEEDIEEQPIEQENIIDESEEAESNIDETASSEINGNDVVNYALQFVGNPYEYGGNSLTDGTDCSGFTSSVYSNFGVSLPRTSSGQINSGENVGTDVANALPGDIVCFDGHVGIYIGDGQMVHAANSRKGVVINNVDYDKPIKAIVRPNITDIVKSNEEIPDESKTM